jgi:hypothetical protein
MLASPADWISPGRADGYAEDPPAWRGEKVSLLDTDHIWGVGGNAAWVWKSFLRGHNPIFMDPYDGSVLGKPDDPRWPPMRRALGQTRRFAERLDLAAMTPADKIASTGYCLAHPGQDYLVYVPDGGAVEVDLSAATAKLSVAWFDPAGERTIAGEAVSGGAQRKLQSPFSGHAVLHLKASKE